MFIKMLMKYCLLMSFVWLISCTTPDIKVDTSAKLETKPSNAKAVVLAPIQNKTDPFLKAKILADILYDAKNAFDDNRLMSPKDDNAYDRYLQVLALAPRNSIAVDGLAEIVSRYVELADESLRFGKYDNAESFLNRASSIDSDNKSVLIAQQSLLEAKKVNVDFFVLDSKELEKQSVLMLVRLSEIADYVKKSEATFLITARTDSEARWIYKVMRESVGGYRLRGNIELGLAPGVQVNAPSI